MVCNNNSDGALLITRKEGGIDVARIYTYTFDDEAWHLHPTLFLTETASQLSCAKGMLGDKASAGFISGQYNKPLQSVVCCNLDLPFSAIDPPSNLVGTCFLNRFALQGEFFKLLSWQLSQASDIASQRLYRNHTLIATLSSSANIVF